MFIAQNVSGMIAVGDSISTETTTTTTHVITSIEYYADDTKLTLDSEWYVSTESPTTLPPSL